MKLVADLSLVNVAKPQLCCPPGTAACRAAPSELDSSFQHIVSTLQQPQQPLTHLYQTNFRQQR